jgi:hypothetical protein
VGDEAQLGVMLVQDTLCRTGEQHRKTLTRRGFYTVESSLEPWSGSVRTVLERDGMFRVYTGSRERG